jgi:hypothetical protein
VAVQFLKGDGLATRKFRCPQSASFWEAGITFDDCRITIPDSKAGHEVVIMDRKMRRPVIVVLARWSLRDGSPLP